MKALDVITIGRSSVDLYGAQVGGRLEDMGSFRKYIGGSPTNIACGAARLGLKSAVITRVGDEHMGRFIREQLQREGVDVGGVVTDPERLTAMVLLGIRDEEKFPLIFYRENCADMALSVDDIDEAYIASSRSLVVTGTHLSNSRTEAAVLKALTLARQHGLRTALDIDYRPSLWGVAGHGDGESRFVESQKVTAKLQSTLHLFDLIVGTEEEFYIAGGSTNTIEALRTVRGVSGAILVCKRGAAGAVAFEGEVPDSLDDGQSGPGFPIEVFNELGAGDGFFAGLLKGWLAEDNWPTALKYANACGAFAVSRHGCTPAYPSLAELEFFLARGQAARPAQRSRPRANSLVDQSPWRLVRLPRLIVRFRWLPPKTVRRPHPRPDTERCSRSYCARARAGPPSDCPSLCRSGKPSCGEASGCRTLLAAGPSGCCWSSAAEALQNMRDHPQRLLGSYQDGPGLAGRCEV